MPDRKDPDAQGRAGTRGTAAGSRKCRRCPGCWPMAALGRRRSHGRKPWPCASWPTGSSTARRSHPWIASSRHEPGPLPPPRPYYLSPSLLPARTPHRPDLGGAGWTAQRPTPQQPVPAALGLYMRRPSARLTANPAVVRAMAPTLAAAMHPLNASNRCRIVSKAATRLEYGPSAGKLRVQSASPRAAAGGSADSRNFREPAHRGHS